MASSVPAVQATGATVATLLSSDGSVGHPHIARLTAARAPLRDLADAIHALCLLHGRHPGVVDLAAERATADQREWFAEAAQAFAAERATLARLASAVGPTPSTAGQAETEAVIIAQCHALAMLARSERSGCSTGAAVAVVLDWRAVRAVLDNAATRLGLEIAASGLPSDAHALLDRTPLTAARATAFGVQQVLAQHRGLWNLLEVRVEARLDH